MYMYMYMQDILYCYPRSVMEEGEGCHGDEDGVNHSLLQLRGVFLTLSDVMTSITTETKSWCGNSVVTCTYMYMLVKLCNF